MCASVGQGKAVISTLNLKNIREIVNREMNKWL